MCSIGVPCLHQTPVFWYMCLSFLCSLPDCSQGSQTHAQLILLHAGLECASADDWCHIRRRYIEISPIVRVTQVKMTASPGQHCQDPTQLGQNWKGPVLRPLERHRRVVNAFTEVSRLLSWQMCILRPLVCGDSAGTGRTPSPQPLLAILILV